MTGTLNTSSTLTFMIKATASCPSAGPFLASGYLVIPLEQLQHIASIKFVSKYRRSTELYYNSNEVLLNTNIKIDYTKNAVFRVKDNYYYDTTSGYTHAEIEITFK